MASSTIALNLTPAAKGKLNHLMQPMAHLQPVAKLIWSPGIHTSDARRKDRAGWLLAFDPVERIDDKHMLALIDGIQFHFDLNWGAAQLDGKTLDYRDGQFFLDEEPLAI